MPEQPEQPERSEAPDPRTIVELDPRTLRGLAHPLRIRLLGSLRANGPATASQLAQQFGESSGSTSYHLRQLAEHGFVVEDAGRGTGRERWWKSLYDGTRIPFAELAADPANRGALTVLQQEVGAIHNQEVATWFTTQERWGADWLDASTLSDYRIQVTPDELRELTRELHAVVERYRHRKPEPGEGDGIEQVKVHLHAFPIDTQDPTAG